MKSIAQSQSRMLAAALAAASVGNGGCTSDLSRDPHMVEDDVDPLESLAPPANESQLAYLQRTIFSQSCASIAGQCHFGQFEPNLSTMSQVYYNLVNRGAIEHFHQYRVDSMATPSASHLLHKLRGTDGVQTIMPLGTDGLPEDQIQRVEQWISSGAKWDDAGEAAPRPNNPPEPPLVQEWSLEGGVEGERLDEGGPFLASVGQSMVFRAAVRDVETTDASIPEVLFILYLLDRAASVLMPAKYPTTVGYGSFDDIDAPELAGERYNWAYEWTVPETVDLAFDDGSFELGVPSSGLVLSMYALYYDLDYFDPETIGASTFEVNEITIAGAP